MSASVFSRSGLAGLAFAGLGLGALPGIAMAQPAAGEPGTFREFQHASKCVVTLGFGGDCDKNAPAPKARKTAAQNTVAPNTVAPAPAAEDASTRHQFMRASKCVVSLGFIGDCDKDGPAPGVRKTSAATAADETSTRHRFMHASKCVVSLGFIGDCDRK